MSFVKKAVKKVVKFVKRVVKSDIFKIVAIAALTFFTAGVAAGGFAAFSGVSGIGSFFTAVGQTIATGASAMASLVGAQGLSASLAAKGGAAAAAAGLAGAPTAAALAGGIGEVALTASAAAGEVAAGSTIASHLAAANVALPAASSGGFLTTVNNVLGKKVLGDLSVGQIAANGITAGIANVVAQKNKEQQEYVNGYAGGSLMRGGTPGSAINYTYRVGEQSADDEAVSVAAAEQDAVAAATANRQLSNEGLASTGVVTGTSSLDPGPGQVGQEAVGRIQQRIAERGLLEAQSQEQAEMLAAQQQGLVPVDSGGYMNLQKEGATAVPNQTFVDQATQLAYQPRRGLLGAA